LPLLLAVLLGWGWMFLPVLSLVISVGLAPFPLAVAAILVRTRRPRLATGDDSPRGAGAGKQRRYTLFDRGDISKAQKIADNSGSNAMARGVCGQNARARR
jgi:hypothetical protein